jgi:hypothetical protein
MQFFPCLLNEGNSRGTLCSGRRSTPQESSGIIKRETGAQGFADGVYDVINNEVGAKSDEITIQL